MVSNINLKTGISTANTQKLEFIRDLVDKGKIKPIIDREYTLDKIAEAHRFVEKGHKVGSVIVTI